MSNQVATYGHYNNKALAGFFSWLRRAVNNVINAISAFLPRQVFMVLDDFTNGDGSFSPFDVFNSGGQAKNFNNPTDIPLTNADEFMLDSWLVNYNAFVLPFFKNLKNVKDGQSTIADIKDVYNNTYKIIAVLKYCIEVSLQDTRNRYSQNALLSRNAFIDIQIGTLESTVNDLISQYSITVKPITEPISFRGSDYNLLDFQLPNVFAAPTKRFAVSAIDDIDISDDDNQSGIIDDIVVPPSPTSDKASTGTYWKWVFAALLLAMLLTRRKNKSLN